LRFRVFVIDDYPPCRDLLLHILGSRGYEVVCFPDTNFCQACNSPTFECSNIKPCCDFLLTDNKMPKVSGLDLLDFQNKGGCKIHPEKKAIISGSWSEHELDQAKSFGCKIFHKPYELSELFSWLNNQEKNVALGRILADRRPYGFGS